MGIRAALRLNGTSSQMLEASATALPMAQAARSGIRSPWAGSSLAPVVYKDFLGVGGVDSPITRAEAMTIPAVVRGISLVTTALSTAPWTEYEGEQAVADQPAWLYATNTEISPIYRCQFVVEDLILGGWSVLLVDRDADGNISTADRIRPDLWEFDDVGRVVVGDEALRPEQYVLIKAPTDGLLLTGRRTLRGALNLETAWQRAVRNPNATTLLKQVGDDVLEDDEIDDLLAAWRLARQDPDGAVAFIPSNIAVEALGSIVADLLVEARNAVAVDIARLIGIPGASVEAGAVQTSLTYQNATVGLGLQLVQQGLVPYANAIAAALSMDNVCAPGRRIAPDMTELLNDAANLSRSGTPTKD